MSLEDLDYENVVIEGGLEGLKCSLARRSFYEYLKLKDPGFYTEGKPHLKELAGKLQDFVDGKLITPNGKVARIFVMNLPPRTGKSYTLTNLCSWVLGRSKYRGDLKTEKIITISYNDSIATDFSRFCRDNFTTERESEDHIPFSMVFPGAKLKRGDSGAKKWAMEGEFFSYMGGGIHGELTGKGCTLGIIDDPIKSSEDANNENTLISWWDFYRNTFRSRIEKGGKQIINHTRWREEDLAGKIENHYGDDVYVYKRCIVENEVVEKIPVEDDHGNVTGYEMKTTGGDLLCEELCGWEEFYDLQRTIEPSTFRSNYFQEPLDSTGKMYGDFRTYTYLPDRVGVKKGYIDTADKGVDSLCAILYEDHIDTEGYLYIIDVLHTKEAMEVTEPEVAEMLMFHKIDDVLVEANSGGRGFARAVDNLLRDACGANRTCVDTFTQTKNKEARILTASYWVTQHVKFPRNWNARWPTFYDELTKHIRDGKNVHDDAADAITGLYDLHGYEADLSYLPMFS